MKKGYKDRTPNIPYTVLATLCFVTLVMCQTRFQVTKEMNYEVNPPILRSRDSWFLYTVGNPDRYKNVLRAFVIISSPVVSLVSTGLVLIGKAESNPYYFIPWLFLTVKSLLLIQTDNLITILRDMATKTNYAFGFRMEDLKMLLFYFTVFLIDLIEAFSFCEVFDLFLALWNHHPGYSVDSTSLEAAKREIAEIVKTWSSCSLGSLSKISLESITDSDDTLEVERRGTGSVVKFSIKDEDTFYESDSLPSKREVFSQNLQKKKFPNGVQSPSSISKLSEGDAPTIGTIGTIEGVKKPIKKSAFSVDLLKTCKNSEKGFPSVDFKEEWKNFTVGIPVESYSEEVR